jgi:NAD+ kinase
MSDGEATSSGERTVGIVAPETDASQVVETVSDAGVAADIGPADIAAESDVVVAVGDGALSSLAAAGVSTPVLPVETGVDGVAETDQAAIERVLAGAYDIQERPFVRVETPEHTGRALFDVSLTTAEPATISEFALDTSATADGDATADETSVARFRADGVTVAAPAGSRGYAHAAGGPIVVPGSDVATVVPIAPFATDPDHWVLPLSGVSLTIERDEADVEVAVDGRPLCTVGPGSTVRLARDGALRIAVPESGSASGREWETF